MARVHFPKAYFALLLLVIECLPVLHAACAEVDDFCAEASAPSVTLLQVEAKTEAGAFRETKEAHRGREGPRDAVAPSPLEEEEKLLGPGQAEAAEGPKESCQVFAYWDYPDGAPPYLLANLKSWTAHTQTSCKGRLSIILVNSSNVKTLIPDLPDEFFRLPYDACKSDFVRYALLHHHGGIYMDTDFLMVKDASPVIDLISSHDLVSYTAEGQDCNYGTFSSNFIGGRRGSRLFAETWEAQKAAVTNHHCTREFNSKTSPVCCQDDENDCQVNWAALGEGISHPIFKRLLQESAEVEYRCFSEAESFTPDGLVTVLSPPMMSKDTADVYWAKRGVKEPFERMMYHLFNSISGLDKMDSRQLSDLAAGDSVMGYLYKKSTAA